MLFFIWFCLACYGHHYLACAFAHVPNLMQKGPSKSIGFSRNVESLKACEKTYIMIKPDGVQRGLVGDVITRFERKGLMLRGIKMVSPTVNLLREHYKDLVDKSFFPDLLDYMSSSPVIAMVWEGENAVKSCRALIGATNPTEALPGTIRSDFAVDTGRNICHGSDSVESAERELKLWFSEQFDNTN